MLDTVFKPDILQLAGGPRLGVEASGLAGGASMNDRGARTVPPHVPFARCLRDSHPRLTKRSHPPTTIPLVTIFDSNTACKDTCQEQRTYQYRANAIGPLPDGL